MNEESGGENELELDEEVVEEEGLRDKLKKLREELKACRKEKEGDRGGGQRRKPDSSNAGKDEERPRGGFLKSAEAGLLREILAVADSMELAIKLKPSEVMGEIYSQLREFLKGRGVSPLECAGKKFDPSEHEALEKEEVAEEAQDNVVLEELQKGWRLYDKVLRPAKVKVGIYKK